MLFSLKFHIRFHHKILGKKHDYRIVNIGTWEGGGGVKSQNANEIFERKINAGFVLGVSELFEKHSFSNILTHVQHEKKLCSKNQI